MSHAAAHESWVALLPDDSWHDQQGSACTALAKNDGRTPEPQRSNRPMEDDLKRRIVYGLLSMILGIIATRLAVYLTNKLLGEPESEAEAIV
jgi:hypothetical protein